MRPDNTRRATDLTPKHGETRLRYTTISLYILLFLFSRDLFAIGLSDFYFQSGVMKYKIEDKSNNQDYYPILLSGKAGYSITPKASVELQIAGTAKEDEYAGQEISAYTASLNMRYGGPKYSAAAMYFLTGISTTRVAVKQGNFEDYEDVNSLGVGFGLEERIFSIKNAKIALEIIKHFSENEEDPEIGTVLLGFRTDF